MVVLLLQVHGLHGLVLHGAEEEEQPADQPPRHPPRHHAHGQVSQDPSLELSTNLHGISQC